jgi:hypothetical protein
MPHILFDVLKIMPSKEAKTIISYGSLPELHELKTARFFYKLG